jgi:hypothetical protein
LAKFEALQRFKTLNRGTSSTLWSRDRETDLLETLTYEIGGARLAQLRTYALLTSSAQEREKECLKLIIEALMEIGNRDRPVTLPAGGEPIW